MIVIPGALALSLQTLSLFGLDKSNKVPKHSLARYSKDGYAVRPPTVLSVQPRRFIADRIIDSKSCKENAHLLCKHRRSRHELR